jgi:hypothetical protein
MACLQRPARDRVHAGVDLRDDPLVGRRVALLDDPRHVADVVAQHPAVAGGSSSSAVSIAARPSSDAASSRSSVPAVSSGVSPGRTSTRSMPAASAGSATSTAWPVPRCSACRTVPTPGRSARDLRGDGLRLVADHHEHLTELERAQRLQHVTHERAAGGAVQHLREVGAEPRALAGGEHDGGDVLGHGVSSGRERPPP